MNAVQVAVWKETSCSNVDICVTFVVIPMDSIHVDFLGMKTVDFSVTNCLIASQDLRSLADAVTRLCFGMPTKDKSINVYRLEYCVY